MVKWNVRTVDGRSMLSCSRQSKRVSALGASVVFSLVLSSVGVVSQRSANAAGRATSDQIGVLDWSTTVPPTIGPAPASLAAYDPLEFATTVPPSTAQPEVVALTPSGSRDSTPIASAVTGAVTLEAEDAENNLTLESGLGGTGRGSLGYWLSVGGYVRFAVTAPVAGTYRLRVRHASAWNIGAVRSLTVGGVSKGAVSFPSSGNWNVWQVTDVPVTLGAGSTPVQFSYESGDAAALNIDNLTFELVSATTTTTAVPASTTIVPTTPVTTIGVPLPPVVGALVLEAEDAANNLVFETSEGGLGRGSLGYWDKVGGYVRFSVPAATTGSYRLRVRHASLWSADATRLILVDGQATGSFSFVTSGAWNSWRTTDTSLQLAAGNHVVELRFSVADVGSMNIDNLTFEPSTGLPTTTISPTTTSPAPTAPPTTGAPLGATLEAEDAVHNLTVEVGLGGTGRGSLGYWEAVGGFVRFAVTAPISGSYRFRFRHSSARTPVAVRSLLIDSQRTGAVTFPSTGAWTNWQTTDVSVALTAGQHTAELSFSNSDTTGMNLDNLVVEFVAAGTVTTAPVTSTAPVTTTTPPSTTTPPIPGTTGAGDTQMCAGPGSRAVVSTILNNRKESLRSWAAGGVASMESLYSILLSPLEMAINCNDVQMLDAISYVVMGSAATLSSTGDGQVWLSNGSEVRLVSAEWINVLARVIDGISSVASSQRTPNMNAVTSQFVSVVGAHLKRWVFDTTFYGLSGCPYIYATGHTGYVSLLRTKTLGGIKSFCYALISTDNWIMAASAEFLLTSKNDPSIVTLTSHGMNESDLAAYVRASGDLIRARLVATNLTRPNGAPAQGLDIDPGGFADWTQDSAWSAYSGTSFPVSPTGVILVPPTVSPRAGWDTSHLRSFVQLVNSLRQARRAAAASFPSDGEMIGLSNQVAYGLLVDGNAQWPQFANYFSGLNGWYRVNYSGRTGFGYGPSDLGNTAYMESTMGLWAMWNPDLLAINSRIGVILQSTDSATINWRESTYAKTWINFERVGSINLYRDSSTFLLQHVASSLGATWR